MLENNQYIFFIKRISCKGEEKRKWKKKKSNYRKEKESEKEKRVLGGGSMVHTPA